MIFGADKENITNRKWTKRSDRLRWLCQRTTNKLREVPENFLSPTINKRYRSLVKALIAAEDAGL
jgi:hypothetical protein